MRKSLLILILTVLMLPGLNALGHAAGMHVSTTSNGHIVSIEYESLSLLSGEETPFIITLEDEGTMENIAYDRVEVSVISAQTQAPVFRGVLTEDSFLVGSSLFVLTLPEAGAYQVDLRFLWGRGGETEVLASATIALLAEQQPQEATRFRLILAGLLILASLFLTVGLFRKNKNPENTH